LLSVKKQHLHHVEVPADPAYLALVEDILANAEVRSMDKYIQHGTTSCLQHSVLVSYLSYRYCRKKGWDARAAARGGLLHDLFLYDWHHRKRQPGELLHGFEHPRKALANARRLFALTPKEEEIILRHMWPLTLVAPRCKEAFVVVMYDKYCSLKETFRRPIICWEKASDANA
jgi:uncharacterized protein